MVSRPSSVLFACDHNAVRSPMAEGMMKRDYGTSIFVQSAGVRHDIEVDGFSVAVCEEVGVTLGKHRARSFEEMEEWGDQIDGYDLIVALSPAAQRAALEYTRYYALEVEYWPIMDPTDLGRTREEKLVAYRQARDQIAAKIRARFGPPLEADE
ncbi:MAG TPA: low molecular weight phosphatase family protein [Rhodobacteraceae bacterium]|nr:low molecular weight phosphatase family protein [Paracoccaceae bacterium]